MKDRDGFPNPMDMSREDDQDRGRGPRRARPDAEVYYGQGREWDTRPDWDRQPDHDSGEGFEDRPRRSRAPRFGRMDGGPYSGYSGFGGPGWTPGGFGDPGYNTSGFGHPDYGASRTGSGSVHQTTQGWEDSLRTEHGPFVGHGPKNYRRADERILDDVCDRLTRNGFVNASDVEIQVVEGEVTLSGAVEDRRQKYVAEDIAESIAGVRSVENRIRVMRRD